MWNPFRRQQPKLGLALGSGGAKGMAHLGALKAFEEENISFDDLKDLIEIAHGDPYVPSLPITNVRKAEFDEDIDKRIFVFERGSQFDLLEKLPNTFMWVSPVPSDVLKKYGLVQRKCTISTKIYKDVLI